MPLDYSQPKYGLTADQLSAIAKLMILPAWHRRKICKAMSGGLRSVYIYKYLTFDPVDVSSLRKARELIVESKLYLAAPSQFNDPLLPAYAVLAVRRAYATGWIKDCLAALGLVAAIVIFNLYVYHAVQFVVTFALT